MKEQHYHFLKVKNGAGWRKFHRLRLMISVGKLYHEGSKLQAVVDWINRNPDITEVQVSINDLLQRHNLIAFGSHEKEASIIAERSGIAWKNRNKEILSGINTGWSFTFWKEWFGSEEYYKAHEAILKLEKEDAGFKAALEQDSNSLAIRKKARGEYVPTNLVECSGKYVREELAVFATQSRHLPAAEVYPGTSLKSVRYLFGKELPKDLTPLSTRHVTRIDFERRKIVNTKAA